ncbi:MAG TPA: LysM peptidoglycan-binding domain-containing protein [Terriglobia bacterium]|nr:LysM peptidoglycan-binding domain-containing protein [Terriglobia bacterium]
MRLLLVTLLIAASALAQEQAPARQQSPAQGPPPKNLTKHPDGHFSANAEPKDVESFEIRVVVTGDTLSAISREILKDGKLWPQIWEQNEHVVNPHWIYPNDKILIRPVTKISDAKPPEPEAPAEAPAPEAPQQAKDTAPQPLKGQLVPAPYPALPESSVPKTVLNLNPPRSYPEVKDADVNCAGFIRADDVSRDVKVVGRYSEGRDLASAGDYLYIGRGVEGGVRPGAVYEVLRPTKSVNGLGMHYLEIAQVQIVTGQADHSLARITYGCDSVEVGDVLIPYARTEFPPLPSKRPFSPMMKASGQVPGNVILTKDAMINDGSQIFGRHPNIQKAGGKLATLDRGIVGEGSVVYLDIGKESGAKPGDLFIVFRDNKVVQNSRTAVAEVVILRVEERASSALVTYSDDAISLGDVVERR